MDIHLNKQANSKLWYMQYTENGKVDQYSIRINQQFRICFKWEDGHAYEVQIADYH